MGSHMEVFMRLYARSSHIALPAALITISRSATTTLPVYHYRGPLHSKAQGHMCSLLSDTCDYAMNYSEKRKKACLGFDLKIIAIY